VAGVIDVVIADDQELVREGLRMMIEAEPDLRVVAEADTGAAAIAAVNQHDPDVVLMDVRMPQIDGIQATRRLVTAGTRARILILTTFDLDEYVYRAMKAGASGFLLKDARREQLAGAIRIVAAGDQMLAPAITRRLIEDFCARPDPSSPLAGAGKLSDRELDVVRRIARGLSNAEIAAELYLSETTIKSHVARILAKLQLRDRVQITVLAYESGLVRAGGSTPQIEAG
jgi:DNA-binding NarL/FixJ family response regulator